MVSVERPFDLEHFHVQRHLSGIGRLFPSSLYSNFSSPFDIDDILERKDMKLGPTLLNSVYPPLHRGRSRYYHFDDTSPLFHSEREVSSIHESPHLSSDVRIIPIKVEYGPVRYQHEKNTRFQHLNGSPKQAEAGKKVEQLESFCPTVSLKVLDSNNNSSRKQDSKVPSRNASESDFNLNEVSDIQSVIEDGFAPEIEDIEITPPPRLAVYRALKSLLTKEDRMIDYIEGDGNCLFRALSKGLYGTEKFHKAMRTFVCDIITTNKNRFSQFVDDEDVEEHIQEMCKEGTWATTCEIYAAATLLQRDIFMLTPDHLNKTYTWMLFNPVFKISEPNSIRTTRECYITLCNTNGNHYDRVVPDHGGCNCFLPYPELDESDPVSSDQQCLT